jgi:molybdopterin molybdotransferase
VIPVETAQQIALDAVSALPAERRALLAAAGCVLAETVLAPISLPPFDNSAMDGYAVLADDTRGANADAPRVLRVTEAIPAGSSPARPLQPGWAARIMTGAPLPAGAEAVVKVEDTRPEGDAVAVLVEAAPGENVRPAGEDLAAGEVALEAGTVLGPGELGLAAALGLTQLSVIRRPRVALLTTGAEVVEPGAALRPGAIYNSHRVALAAALSRAGAEVARVAHVPDDAAAIEQALRESVDCDLIITTGGVSMGDYDFVKVVLERLGEVRFWQVRMKPGKPVAFGLALGRPVFALPGNPVSALVTFEVLVRPALRGLAGQRACFPPTVEATLSRDIAHQPGRREYVQAHTRWTEAGYVVTPSGQRGSAMLRATVGANSLLVIPEDSVGLRKGERAQVLLTRDEGRE